MGILTFTVTDADPVVYIYDKIHASVGDFAAAFERDTLAVTRLITLADVSEDVRVDIQERLAGYGYNDSDVLVFSRGRVDCEADACRYTFEGYLVDVGKDVVWYMRETDEDRVLDRLNEFLEEAKEWVR